MIFNTPMLLDKDSDEPLYVQLYKIIKSVIEKGELKHNEKLPSIRQVSSQLNINSSTVVNAYRLLESNSYAYSRAGSGTFVYNKRSKPYGLQMTQTEFNMNEKSEKGYSGNFIDFASSTPDPSLFPVNSFKEIMNEVMDKFGGQAFDYMEIQGYRPLRESICEYVVGKGIKCTPEGIQIISGAQQGIDIIARVLIDFGDVILTEMPTYTGAVAVFKSRGADIIGVNIQEGGIDTSDLEEKLKAVKPRFLYVMTNFQNPTGYSYSTETMDRLLYLADKYDFYIIEDDYLSELSYDCNVPVTMKSNDNVNRVIYIKSFSKIFMPGIRLGFLIVPEVMRERVTAAKHLADISTSGFMQRVLDLYIRHDMLNNHISSIKSEYHKRYKFIKDYIKSNMQNIEFHKPEGGTHLWLKLPGGLSSNMLYSESLMHNVIVSPGSAFYIDSMDSQYFRLSYASTGIEDIERGIDIIGKIINRI